MYERTIKAMQAHTRSLKVIAESLALDIPPREPGQGSDEDMTVMGYLEDLRQTAIEMGCEPVSAPTLYNYRRVALWAAGGGKAAGNSDFRWVKGYSFTSHQEALFHKISIDEYHAKPRHAREIREEEGGRNTKDGPPKTKDWTPEQRVEVVKQIVQDTPEAFRAAVADPQVLFDASTIVKEEREAADERHRERERRADEKRDKDLISQRIDQLAILNDLSASMRHLTNNARAFGREVADIFPRLPKDIQSRQLDIHFLTDGLASTRAELAIANEILDRVDQYLTRGTTDLDEFLAGVLKER